MKITKLNVISVLAAIGLVISLYLTYAHYTLIHGKSAWCLGGEACATLNASIYSEVFSIPIALIGASGMIAIFVLSLLNNQKWVFYLSLAGMGFVAYLLYIELVIFGELCPLCTSTHVIGALILILSYNRKYLNLKSLLNF